MDVCDSCAQQKHTSLLQSPLLSQASKPEKSASRQEGATHQDKLPEGGGGLWGAGLLGVWLPGTEVPHTSQMPRGVDIGVSGTAMGDSQGSLHRNHLRAAEGGQHAGFRRRLSRECGGILE